MTAVHHVVCGILLRDGHVLLGHRSAQKQWYPNVWDFPGGHIEAGEVAFEALRRELHEELGITVLHAAPCKQIARPEVHLEFWLLESWVGMPANLAPEEHDDLRWFTLPETQELNLADEFYPELIAELFNR